MPGPKQERREHTDEWSQVKQWTLWPEQEWYEAIRPLVLFHETAGQRAKAIDIPQSTLARKADEFEKYGMRGLFAPEDHGGARESAKTLPSEIRLLIVDLHFEHPAMSWREIAEICYISYARRPDHKSVKHIAIPVLPQLERPGAISPGTRFSIQQSANWQWFGFTAKGGRLLLSLSICNVHDTPSTIPWSAGQKRAWLA